MDAAARRRRLEEARLYLVTDARPAAFLDAVLAAGVDVLQLREKNAADRAVLEAAQLFRRACDAHGALFVLNDRPDLAAQADADGVHVGQDDAAVEEARRLVGPDVLVGLSTHSREQIAAADGVDYVAVGPVWATPTKPGRPAVGLELVAAACELARTPFFAIGGIDETNAAEVVATGARRIAVVRAIRDAPDPAAAARALRAIVSRA
jgi:thiamine-phosphate pyrophosphorylase